MWGCDALICCHHADLSCCSGHERTRPQIYGESTGGDPSGESPAQPMSLEFGTQEGRVALFLRSLQKMEEFIVGPITANYPNCSITTVEQNELCPIGWETWTADLEMAPELFPILRHAQFEDMFKRNFADPINGILRAIKPDKQMQCRIEIVVSLAKPRRCHRAAHVVKRLDCEFFRHNHRLARSYARHITRSHGWLSA